MEKAVIIKRIGSASSSAFFQIGNSLNLNKFRSTEDFINIKIPNTDFEALESDWSVVGSEVKSAIDRLGKSQSFRRESRNIEFNDYTKC